MYQLSSLADVCCLPGSRSCVWDISVFCS